MNDLNFLYDDTKLNKNKLKENWLRKNNPKFLEKLLEFKSTLNFELSIFSQLIWHYKNNQLVYPICEYCQGENSRYIGFEKGYEKTCSRHCGILLSRPGGIEQRKKNTLEKYGVEHTTQLDSVKKKMVKTNLEKYGVESYAKTDEFINKIKKTNTEKYGVEFPLQNNKIYNKLRSTMIETWGNDNSSKIPEIIEMKKRKSIEKYGVEYSVLRKDVREKIKNTITNNINNFYKNLYPNEFLGYKLDENKVSLRCLNDPTHIYECQTYFLLQRKRRSHESCLICNPINNKISNGHQQIIDFLLSLDPNLNIIINDRKNLQGLEIYIYLPDYQLGIEYHGIYWHSELHKTKTYHLEKYLKAKERGIDLIQIWEDTFLDKGEVIKSILKNRLGIVTHKIGARQCVIKSITSKIANDFLEINHLQGSCVSSIRYGLYYGNELLCVATFGKGRVNLGNKKDEWEILRLATQVDWVVTGGLIKLFKHFINEINPTRVISYSDNDLFTGSIYQKLGMSLESDKLPSYTWSDGFIRKNRWGFRKDKLVKEGADPSLTEVEIMQERGWFRCYSAGQKKWIINL